MADCFIDIEGVKGESEDPDFRNTIQVSGWEWGMSWEPKKGGVSRQGSADMRNLVFTHILDTASPALMARCMAGKVIPSATLSMRKAGGKAHKYLVIKLEKVLITDIEVIHDEARTIPEERVRLAFQKVRYEYMAQSERGGAGGGAVSFDWQTLDSLS